MGKIAAIFPGFNVEPGNCSLTVCDYDFLKRKLGDKLEKYGAGFYREMGDRFAGHKLKLHHIRKLKGGPLGALYHFYFSENSDTYTWNEYMFKEFWSAGGRVQYDTVARARAESPKRDIRSFDEPEVAAIKEVYTPPKQLEYMRSENKIEDAQPSKMSKLLKIMFIMNMMNMKK